MVKIGYKYLESCKPQTEKFEKSVGTNSVSYTRIIHANLPMIEGLARVLNVALSTLYEWEKEHKDFSELLGAIRVEQHNRLIEGGLSGDFSPVITKLMLSSRHDYKEKTDITTQGEKLSPFSDDQLDAIFERRAARRSADSEK